MKVIDPKTKIQYKHTEQTELEQGTCVGCAFTHNNPEADLLCDMYGHLCKGTNKVFKEIIKDK